MTTFKAAFRRELESLKVAGEPKVAFSGSLADGDATERPPLDPGAEPFAVGVPADLAGLALSGGGIRSATFNLGLLQGLADRDVLRHFHYVSTVSGGGYVGGFWSAWRARHPEPATTSEGRPGPVPFPTAADAEAARSEHEAIRHLREFSRFLAPRWGLFELETWQFFGGAISAILPTIIVGLSVLTLVVWFAVVVSGASLGFNSALPLPAIISVGAALHVQAMLAIMAISTIFVLTAYELKTAAVERHGGEPYYLWLYATAGAIAIAVALSVTGYVAGKHGVADFGEFPGPEMRWPTFLAPAIGWLAAMVALIFVRTWSSVFISDPTIGSYRAAFDRVIARLLGLSVFWMGMIAFLIVAFMLFGYTKREFVTAGAGGVATALYAVLQKFLSRQPNRAKTGFVGKVLQRYAQPLLAIAALIAFALAAAFLVFTDLSYRSFISAMIAAAIVVMALLLYNPNEIGMHALYRSRLARSYLGASNTKASCATENRQSTQRPGDDILMQDLRTSAPIHLVCCTANDLSGNHLANLSRGGRSATLSPFGITLANRFQQWKDATTQVSLASAMTASAAAFNSNMGSVSMDIGPSATFLMASLNLRLGYWYRFTKAWSLPGTDLLAEMFSRTYSGPESQSVHLSDGGHFENLGLYELLRRRCKYIIVSDCGADPDVAFDDVGNALRRAREDFGVEIEMDLGVLKPDDKRYSRQHLAVGDIQYPDGDRGILLLFKPTLVGDEPGDILQYRARNEQFPHESTGDQFYDEKQWESYRRLGLHAARAAFEFVADAGAAETDTSELFGDARWKWLPVPADLEAQLLGRTNQLEQLQRQLIDADESLVRDLFPELKWDADTPPLTHKLTPEKFAHVVPLFTQVIQLMEDVYIGCQMERYSTHPLNLGWLNEFGRWTTTQAFRELWPFFAPMYNPQMVRFIEQRFDLSSTRNKKRLGAQLVPLTTRAGVAFELWKAMYPGKAAALDSAADIRSYEITVENRTVSVGLLFAQKNGTVLEWKDGDLFVPPSFWGARIGNNILELLTGPARVKIDDLPSRRKEINNLTQLYRQAGFRQVDGGSSKEIVMERGL
ncbi:MAG: hypothetical protein QOI24_2152 [Acidobacteriota bacterium]|jgi:hypothetical protein|nr:hypothetical protein [Acidobacteriota bacterium]